MASSKVITTTSKTNPDVPRQPSLRSSLSTLLADLQNQQNNNQNQSQNCLGSVTMNDLLKNIYSSTPPQPTTSSDANAQFLGASISREGSFSLPKDVANKSVDEVWKEIVTGGGGDQKQEGQLEEMTLEDFLTKAGAVREEDVGGVVNQTLVVVPAGLGAMRGERRAVEEPPLDKATQQKQRRMIKNRESAARSRERKQAYTVELESMVSHLEEENALLLREELMKNLIPVMEKQRPRRAGVFIPWNGFDRVDLGEMAKGRIGKQQPKLGEDRMNLGIDMETRKMQKKGIIEVLEQALEVNEETLPSWWVEQKAELEGRIQTLEDGMTENRGYLQRILQLVNQAAEEKDSPQSERSQSSAAEKQNKGECKQPCLVTVPSEHEKYTFKPNEPGILAAKPVEFTSPLPFNPKVQEENIMGSSSEIKVDSKGENYFVFSFISGLKEELKHKVKVLEPKNLSEAYRQAKLYELANEIEGKKYKSPSKFFSYTLSNSQQNSGNRSLLPKPVPPNSNPKQNLLDYRRANNLCFKCGEKFVLGHQCKVRQLNCMEEDEPTDSAEQDLTEGENREVEDQAKEALEIFINVITRNVGHTTLRIQGFIKGKPINVLIDSGITHSFITPQWAKEGVELVHTQPLVISVANGDKLFSTAKSNKVSWKMHGYDFQHDFSVISGSAEVEDSVVPLPLQELLEEFKEVFEEPRGMSPSRKHDHAIVLKQGTQPVNLRPYRFVHHHKAEVEKQITEMLSSSIIQVSKSPFASPCLLIKKKDETLRFCVDYRKLNSATVKNKFLIPIVEDLLDELNEAVFFSKIDLRSGYWQIRIKEEDIPKTAFRTHQGHYEFKVMSFGLINAPATFQALMNDLFGEYLRKFVLVFFYDILIYSPSLEEHKQHLRTVLEVLLKNRLYAKRSKCFFGQQQVEYLGHLISADVVVTDPNKVKAMQQWPLPKNLKALRGFLGLTGYYRIFIRGYGELNFFLETDASSKGIGAVISQAGRPITYLSKALGPKHADLSIYENEKGKSNRAADALSRQQLDSGEFVQMGVTVITPTWVQDIEKSYEDDVIAHEKIPILVIKPDDLQD
ncbi:hypothetical protein F3Y22_tig00110105pilonHSYRG00061 [Hibiscus syriacus]|uniref:RNA-directed DNA polymerase n=1 Tax=Hibiscus syriacus TaxID=106335 RepID=A0A6A3BJS4_HIBSY|nr:hypothetical protein F3Y22_tig00110105pilonHSYRG00061 [Hibiscus syriacus]